ncbi:MAG TPA: hypothetical protein VIJ79_03900 [Acidobacteriaceae bacterium]
MNQVPQELNWVEKRAACTVAKVFNQLCNGIIEDVQSTNSVRQLPADSQFQADMNPKGNAIRVAQPAAIPRARVSVGIANERIAVQEEWANGKHWSATVGLNDEGRCTLRLEDGTELEQWQFRKRALESLLFGEMD